MIHSGEEKVSYMAHRGIMWYVFCLVVNVWYNDCMLWL